MFITAGLADGRGQPSGEGSGATARLWVRPVPARTQREGPFGPGFGILASPGTSSWDWTSGERRVAPPWLQSRPAGHSGAVWGLRVPQVRGRGGCRSRSGFGCTASSCDSGNLIAPGLPQFNGTPGGWCPHQPVLSRCGKVSTSAPGTQPLCCLLWRPRNKLVQGHGRGRLSRGSGQPGTLHGPAGQPG